jgi:hypothetical protein
VKIGDSDNKEGKMFQAITNKLTTMAGDANKERTLDMKKLLAAGLLILALLLIGVGQTKPNAACVH